MKKFAKYVLLTIMAMMVLVVAGCGSSESDNFTGKWITKDPKTNVTVLDIQPEKDKQVLIKATIYGYKDKQTKKTREAFTNEIHHEYLSSLTRGEKDIKATVNKKELITEDGAYIFNEQDKTIIINNVVYTKYIDENEVKTKIDQLKPLKEQEIKDRTKNASMFTHYYDRFDYDDSAFK